MNTPEEAGDPSNGVKVLFDDSHHQALYDEALRFLDDNYVMQAYPLFGGFLRLEARKFLLRRVNK